MKTILIVAATAAFTSAATFVYVGRTTYSSPFQADLPFNSAFKVTPDAGNIWSWHHDIVHVNGGPPTVADVLVDIDGDQVMDTVHSAVRVIITDLEVVAPAQSGLAVVARLVDSGGKRLSVGTGNWQGSGPVHHVGLTTPIVLPVGSFLHVELQGDSATYEVNIIGRIVNP